MGRSRRRRLAPAVHSRCPILRHARRPLRTLRPRRDHRPCPDGLPSPAVCHGIARLDRTSPGGHRHRSSNGLRHARQRSQQRPTPQHQPPTLPQQRQRPACTQRGPCGARGRCNRVEVKTLLMLLCKNLNRADRLHDQKKTGVLRALQAALKNAARSTQGLQGLLHRKHAPAHSRRRNRAHRRPLPRLPPVRSKPTPNSLRPTSCPP